MPTIAEYAEVPLDWGSSNVDEPKPGEIQVFYKEGVPHFVDFICPCGCGMRCPTPIETPDRKGPGPKWTFSKSPDGKITLNPSIRLLSGCKAHFNITNGKVIIHNDSGK